MKLGDRFAPVSDALRSQYARAKNAQWCLDDVGWDAHALELGPAGIRPRRNLAATLYKWSNALVGAAGRLTAEHANSDAQLLLAVHVHDYARHTDVWRQYLELTHGQGDVPEDLVRTLIALETSRAPMPLLGVLAHGHLPLLDAIYGTLGASWCCPLGRRVCTLLGGDIARHRVDVTMVLRESGHADSGAGEAERLRLAGLEKDLTAELDADTFAALQARLAGAGGSS